MTDPLQALYQARPYPPMSHPVTHPMLIAAAATLAGLHPPKASTAHILELGCASGHNILPLAQAFPNATFTGVDFSPPAIELARAAATAAGLTNITFIQADLRTFDPGGQKYDYIIAHGVYSWVDRETQAAVLNLCHSALSENGVACLSYNVLPGWSLRQPLALLAGALAAHPSAATTSFQPLHGLPDLLDAYFNEASTPYAQYLREVVHDMAAKGKDLLAFDDLAPVNQPCYFVEFLDAAERAGLHYLGESNPSQNTPAEINDPAREKLKAYADDPRLLQQLIDFLLGRTFRSSLLCRGDAPLHEVTAETILNLSARTTLTHAGSIRDYAPGARMRFTTSSDDLVIELDHPVAKALLSTLIKVAPACPTLAESITAMHTLLPAGNFDTSPPRLARLIMDGVRHGWIELRSEPTGLPAPPGEQPAMTPLHLYHATRSEPLVDSYHQPCSFRVASHYQLAAAMDGSKSIQELDSLARKLDPTLDFHGWLHHLHLRGLVR